MSTLPLPLSVVIVGIFDPVHIDVTLSGEIVGLIGAHHKFLLLTTVLLFGLSLLIEVLLLLVSSLFEVHAVSVLFFLPVLLALSTGIFLEFLCPSHVCHLILSFFALLFRHAFLHFSPFRLFFLSHFNLFSSVFFIDFSNFFLPLELRHFGFLFLSFSLIELFLCFLFGFLLPRLSVKFGLFLSFYLLFFKLLLKSLAFTFLHTS